MPACNARLKALQCEKLKLHKRAAASLLRNMTVVDALAAVTRKLSALEERKKVCDCVCDSDCDCDGVSDCACVCDSVCV